MEYHSNGIAPCTPTPPPCLTLRNPNWAAASGIACPSRCRLCSSPARRRLRGKVLNISVGGALFESDRKRVRFPGPCVLRLPIEAASGDQTFIQAQVVRTSEGRFGLRWTQRIPAHALIKLALPLER